MSGLIVLLFRILLALVLLGFMLFAMYLLWQELNKQKNLLSNMQIPLISLKVLNSNNKKEYSYSIREIIIGRDSTCECQMDDKTVSSRHARLSYHHSHWWIEDIKSKNGTYLNNELISESRVITSNDIVRIGNVSFLVNIDG